MTKVLRYMALGALLVACGDDSLRRDAAVGDGSAPAGTVTLTWRLTDGSDAILCSDVAASTVRLSLRPANGQVGLSEAFSCSSSSATSLPFPEGEYDLEIDLRASGQRSLLDQPLTESGIAVRANQNTDLGSFDFAVATQGILSFKLDAGAGGSNCKGGGANNGGMVGAELQLTRQDNTCIDGVQFTIGEGGGQSGVYESDCDTPLIWGCIDKDQAITVDPAPSGPLSLDVLGYKEDEASDPVACYSRSTDFVVPGAGLLIELGGGLLELDLFSSSECDPDFVGPDASPDAS